MTTADASTSTELALRPLSELTTLDLSEKFLADYQTLNPEVQTELFQELEEDGITLNLSHLTRVKVPTGGITQFMITDEDGVEQAVRELVGVVLAALDRRSYWKVKFGEAGSEEGPPDCSSRDGKLGDGMYGVGSELHPSGECATCPMAARGSAGTGTQASACKSQKLLFLASTQELLPMIVAVPPASLANWTKFRVGGVIKSRRRAGGPKEIKLTLAKKKNPNNIEYAEIEFTSTGRDFTPDERTVISAFKARMQQMIKENQEALDAMAAASAANQSTMEAAAEDGTVPFDEVADGALPQDEDFTGAASTGKR